MSAERGSWRSIAGAGFVCTFVLSSCATGGDEASDRPSHEHLYSSASLVSVDSPADAVAFSDTVAVFTITHDGVIEGNPQDTGGAWIDGRHGSIQIDEVIWSRSDAKQPPSTFTTHLPGWFHPQGQDDGVPMRAEHGVRAEVGPTYLAPILFLSGEWGFSDTALFMVIDGRVIVSAEQQSELAHTLKGLSLAEAADVFDRATPSPESGPLNGTTTDQLEAIGVSVD